MEIFSIQHWEEFTCLGPVTLWNNRFYKNKIRARWKNKKKKEKKSNLIDSLKKGRQGKKVKRLPRRKKKEEVAQKKRERVLKSIPERECYPDALRWQGRLNRQLETTTSVNTFSSCKLFSWRQEGCTQFLWKTKLRRAQGGGEGKGGAG